MKLKNVRIPSAVRGFQSEGTLFDVEIENGLIISIYDSDSDTKNVASGTLLPCFADIHTHIDKNYVIDTVGAADGDLFTAIGLMSAHRDSAQTEDIYQRMLRALTDAYSAGTRALRTHLDWTNLDIPKSAAVFERLHQEWQDRITLQCVSLTPLDMFDGVCETDKIAAEVSKINKRLLQKNSKHIASRNSASHAALLGAFVYRNDDMHVKLQRVFDVANRYDLNLDFHVDEGLHQDAVGLRCIAELTIRNNYEGRVTCGHCCSLSSQSEEQAKQTLALCAQAQILIVALPTTNLYLQGAWDATPSERGITRLYEANKIGVATAIATDNVMDGFFPYGSYDLLETFGLGVQVAHLSPADAWLTSITTHPAAAMGLAWDGKIAVDCPADFVIVAARSPYELLSPRGRLRRIIRSGEYV